MPLTPPPAFSNPSATTAIYTLSLHALFRSRKRILTLLDPTQDPLGAGYHIIQSTIAVGSGGISGKGWLNGTQAHLEFIPERHTRSEEHTSELQSHLNLVCRLLLEKKKHSNR